MKRFLSLVLTLVMMVSVLGPAVFTVQSSATQSHSANFSGSYTLTGDGAADIVAVAFAQQGKTGSQLGYTEEWCADFVGDCSKLAGQQSAVPLYGAPEGLRNRIINAGGYAVSKADARKGDVAFYDWNGAVDAYEHVEIVYSEAGSPVATIGGNTGDGSDLYTRHVSTHNTNYCRGRILEIVRPNYKSNTPKYTVTFKDWDGTVLKTQTVTSGGNASPPSNPSRTGYTFTGWSGAYTNVTSNRTITATYESTYESIFNFDASTGTITGLTDYGKTLSEVIIPPAIGGVAVTSIGDWSFEACTSLTSVRIPDGVTSIGNCAFFGCRSLTSVTIPNSVTSIGEEGTFYQCESLTSVIIPNGVTSIGECAFYECNSLKNVTIPDSVTSIGWGAFYGCTSLTSVTIPDSVTTIGEDAFDGCTSLASVTIPDSVTTIGNCAFYNCTSLTSVTIPDSVKTIGGGAFKNTAYYNNSANWTGDVLYLGKWLIKAKDTLSGAYEIKSGTVGTAGSAFEDCTSLTSVTIPDSVIIIGWRAFQDCTSLTNVYYNGTETQWRAIQIGSDNDPLLNAKIKYNRTPSPTQYTVTFKDHDGTTLETQTVNYGANATPPPNPSRTGYTFTGWNGTYTNITSNRTVTAQYKINTYTVTFKNWDGATLKTQTVNHGANASPPPNPSRTGYTFTGWNGTYTNITSNRTITAQYKINTYTVTFKDHDGTTLETQTVNYGANATPPPNPSRTGYTFTGWDGTYTNITSNRTITAQYKLNPTPQGPAPVTYTVTLKDNGDRTATITAALPAGAKSGKIVVGTSAELAYVGGSLASTVGAAGGSFQTNEKYDRDGVAGVCVSFVGQTDALPEGTVVLSADYAIAEGAELDTDDFFVRLWNIADKGGNRLGTEADGDVVKVYVPAPRHLPGDVNGDYCVDNVDASLILQYDAGLIMFSQLQMTAGDVNSDDETDNVDASLILQYDAGIIDRF